MAKNGESKEGLTAFEFNVRRVVVVANSLPNHGVIGALKEEFQAYYMEVAETYEEFENFVSEVLFRYYGSRRKPRCFDDEYFAIAKRDFKYFRDQRGYDFSTPEPKADSQPAQPSIKESQMSNANNASSASNNTESTKETKMNTETNTNTNTSKKSNMKSYLLSAIYWIFMAMFVVVVLPVYAVGMLAYYFLKHVGMGAYFAVVETGKSVWVKARAVYAKASAWVKNLFSSKDAKEQVVPEAAQPAAAA